eukprot:scaffold114934_cov17-Tisochrysis_lutea.AAC.2
MWALSVRIGRQASALPVYDKALYKIPLWRWWMCNIRDQVLSAWLAGVLSQGSQRLQGMAWDSS